MCLHHHLKQLLPSPSETTHSFSSTAFVLPIFDPAQPEVILPLDSSSSILHNDSHDSFTVSRMQTRLQTSAILRKNYATFLAASPELQTWQF